MKWICKLRNAGGDEGMGKRRCGKEGGNCEKVLTANTKRIAL